MKRFVNAVKNFIKKSPPVATSSINVPISNGVTSNLISAMNESTLNNEKNSEKIIANEDLRNAVKELSMNTAIPMTSPPIEVIGEWQNKDVSELQVDQVEELARLYYEGSHGIEKNVSKAVELWKVAGDRGSIEGKYSRALCLKDGVGIDQDKKEALKTLLELAEEKNYNLAHYSAAVMLEKGEGVDEPDLPQAFHHYKLAARSGVQPALHNIANCYFYGKGVKQSDHNALLYYEAGVESGDPSSHFTLATLYYHGKAGLVADKKKAFDLQLVAAQHNHPAAMFNVAVAYLTGDGIKAEPELAAPWFEKAIQMNIVEAALNLSKMYVEGNGVPKDLNKAKEILSRFAHKNEIAAALIHEMENLPTK